MRPTTTLAATPESTPLAEYLTGVLRLLRPLAPLDMDLTQSSGRILADEVRARTAFPAYDHAAIDGYAVRSEDILGATPDRPVRLSVVGDLTAASWRSARLVAGTCFAVAAGAPLPAGADVVVPPADTDQGMTAVEIRQQPKRGNGLRRAGEEIEAGTVLAGPGDHLTPALVAMLAATGVGQVTVRPSPRVAVIASGDELVDAGRASQAGQVVDVDSHALAACVADAGAMPYRVGICDDDPDALHRVIGEQLGQTDLIVTTGGTGAGPGDMVRRVTEASVRFTAVTLHPCSTLGFGQIRGIPIVCLPGDPGSALIGFEVLARPVIRKLAGADRVFRPAVRAHLLETLVSPLGRREFRPAKVSERRGGGYTAQPMPGGPYTLSGMAMANALIVLGERIGNAPAGSTVDVLMLDRRR
jgi:molybdopterin molybdotransferase